MILLRGSRGDNVELVQRLLARAGLYDGDIDGWYGPMTEAAMTKWQGHLRVKPTGQWDADTVKRSRDFIQFLGGNPVPRVDAPPRPWEATL